MIIPNIWENKSHVPNHQPEYIYIIHTISIYYSIHYSIIPGYIMTASIHYSWLLRAIPCYSWHVMAPHGSPAAESNHLPGGRSKSGTVQDIFDAFAALEVPRTHGKGGIGLTMNVKPIGHRFKS